MLLLSSRVAVTTFGHALVRWMHCTIECGLTAGYSCLQDGYITVQTASGLVAPLAEVAEMSATCARPEQVQWWCSRQVSWHHCVWLARMINCIRHRLGWLACAAHLRQVHH